MSDNPWDREQLQEQLLRSPFNAFLNLEVQSVNLDRQELVVHVQMRPEFERMAGSGQWHGGPIAAAIDVTGDYALAMLIGNPLPTIHLSVDYLRPAHGRLKLVARVRRRGKTVGVVDVEVLNESGVLLAVGRASYSTASS
jgi:uncharacterized protein (TIGR00369 family)